MLKLLELHWKPMNQNTGKMSCDTPVIMLFRLNLNVKYRLVPNVTQCSSYTKFGYVVY